MNGDYQNCSVEKISNNFGSFSTSESTHSKNNNKICQIQPELSQNRPLRMLELNQLQSNNHIDLRKSQENDLSNRLFTFMDEKQTQRRIIQTYIYKGSNCKRQNKVPNQPNKQTSPNYGIMKIIQDSRQKREYFLKKLSKNKLPLKQNRSRSRFNLISKSKTPKNMPYFGKNKTQGQNKYDTLQPRSRSKTPKLEPQKYNTLKAQFQMKLFRAKSNLGKEKCKIEKREQKNQSIIKKEKQIQQQSKHEDYQTVKQLLYKKRQLLAQLSAINESILNCRNSDNRKKKTKTKKATNKKSGSKLCKQ